PRAAQTLQMRLDGGRLPALPLRLEVRADAIQSVTDCQRQAVEVGQVVGSHDPRSWASPSGVRSLPLYPVKRRLLPVTDPGFFPKTANQGQFALDGALAAAQPGG